MKDTEKALKEEPRKHFIGKVGRLKIMSKLGLSVLKMSVVNFAQLTLILHLSVKDESNFKQI